MSESTESNFLKFEDWGLVDYSTALDRQLEYVEDIRAGRRSETVVFCQHPPVVTVGRATLPGDVTTWSGSLVEVQRGGRATYHGPNQLIFYPLLDLQKRGQDLHQYLRWLEEIVILFLKSFEIEGVRNFGATGVWVRTGGPKSEPKTDVDLKKIASLGVAVRKWVSFHGVAINLTRDEKAFLGIKPCGFDPQTMVSVEEALGWIRKEAPASLSTNALPAIEEAKSRLRVAILSLPDFSKFQLGADADSIEVEAAALAVNPD